MESTYSCLKKYCWSKYAAIHNFEWNKETTWGSSLKFLLTVVLGYVALIQALNALLARRKNVIPLGYIPTLHHLLLAVGSAIMFLGCLQTTVVEFERSSWLLGRSKTKHRLSFVFSCGDTSSRCCFFLVLCVLLERALRAS